MQAWEDFGVLLLPCYSWGGWSPLGCLVGRERAWPCSVCLCSRPSAALRVQGQDSFWAPWNMKSKETQIGPECGSSQRPAAGSQTGLCPILPRERDALCWPSLIIVYSHTNPIVYVTNRWIISGKNRLEKQVVFMTTPTFSPQGLVSIPAPCQYAHKLTFLVAQSIHKEPSLQLANSLFYLWWREPSVFPDEDSQESSAHPLQTRHGCDWGKETDLSFNFWEKHNNLIWNGSKGMYVVFFESDMLGVDSHCGIWN